MERHVTSRIISEILKALGLKQESEFYWCPVPKIGENGKSYFDSWDIQHKDHMRYFGKKIRVSAFLASELMDMLPTRSDITLSIEKGNKEYHTRYWWGTPNPLRTGSVSDYWATHDKSMVESLALMLEYLIQNKMI